MLRLAFRNLLRQRARTAITLTAVAFGVMGLVLSGGFVRDVFFQLAEALIHSQSGHLQISRLGFFDSGTRSPERFLISDVEPALEKIRSMPRVDDAMARVNFSGLLSNGRRDLAIVGEGVEALRERRLGSFLAIVAGRHLSDADADGILVGAGVADSLQLKPGDPVTLLVSSAGGALNSLDLSVVGVFQSFSKDFDARAVRIGRAAARELLNHAGANTIVVSLKETSETEEVAADLRASFSADFYEIKDWRELNDFYEKTVDLYRSQFGALRLIVLILVLLSVANAINMNAFERIGEFGMMMALGNRRAGVFRQVVLEAAMLGAIAATFGVIAAVLVAAAVATVGIPMPPPPNASMGYLAYIRLVPAEVMAAFAVGLVATVLASLFPAWRVCRMPIASALRDVT
jgi:putative ABC transport system permease protein